MQAEGCELEGGCSLEDASWRVKTGGYNLEGASYRLQAGGRMQAGGCNLEGASWSCRQLRRLSLVAKFLFLKCSLQAFRLPAFKGSLYGL